MPPNRISPHAPDRVSIESLSFPASPQVPNNEAFCAVVARNAFDGAREASLLEALFAANGWGGTWVWQVFGYHHFHPDAFEVLGVAKGGATLMLGGPQGATIDVEAGDIMLLPPGFGHKQMEKRAGFTVVGGYPPGQEAYTVVRGDAGYGDPVREQIARTPAPESDPVWGGAGVMLAAMKKRA